MGNYRIKGLMVEKGFRQSEIAKHLKMSSRSFNLKVNGKREFKQTELIKLSTLLNVSLDEMLGGEKHEKR